MKRRRSHGTASAPAPAPSPDGLVSKEIGSLRALATGESQFVGSSSGVFFINTVRRAFSSAVSQSADRRTADTSPEDCIVDQTPQNTSQPNGPSEEPGTSDLDACMTSKPSYEVARQLVLGYFRIWHPLVPFLHGPTCLAQLDELYSGAMGSIPLERFILFRCVFNIARLDRDGDIGRWAIPSAASLLPSLALLTLRCDLPSIQALLAAQLYFVSTMALHRASSVGGLVSRSIAQSGMHRCPFRYWHLSDEDRVMRKRVFWSAYVLDRFLSQSLGHPNGLQDSDIDVCVPGSGEHHEPVARSAGSPTGAVPDDTILHLPDDHLERQTTSPKSSSRRGETEASPMPAGTPAAVRKHRQQTQETLEHHIHYSQLVGRLLEIFHKSLHVRDFDDRAALFLKADIAAWGNDLPEFLELNDGPGLDLAPDPSVFPLISYHYCVLLANRPSLSLSPASPEFRMSLQACISASGTILQSAKRYASRGGPLFWPGYMSAVWMSGLVLVFAAQLHLCNRAKALSSIAVALELLTIMSKRWLMAARCKEVVSRLLADVQAGPQESQDDSAAAQGGVAETPSRSRNRNASNAHSRRTEHPEHRPEATYSASPSGLTQPLGGTWDAEGTRTPSQPFPDAWPLYDTTIQLDSEGPFDVFDGATWGPLINLVGDEPF